MLTKAERTRNLIVNESARLFNQKGYAGTSMQDILKATKLSKGAVYGHFNDKESIAIAAFDHAVAQVWQQVRDRTRIIERIPDKIKAVVYFYKERVLNPPVEGGCPIQNTTIDADDNNPALRQRAVEAMDYWQKRIERTIDLGIERGEIRSDLDKSQFAVEFICTLEGGIMMAQLYKDIKYFDVMAKRLLEMVDNIENK